MSFTYLGSPYSHASKLVRFLRFYRTIQYAAHLMAQGDTVFSPIAHSHPIAEFLPQERVCDHDFWMAQDLPLLRHADRLVVLMLDGWQVSRGVTEEIAKAAEWGILIEYHEPLSVLAY